jgi:hypothetical protein
VAKNPPANATPLDDHAYAAMKRVYGPELLKFYGITGVVVR